MPSSNRSSSDSRKLAIAPLIMIGAFLAFFGWGWGQSLVVALGVIVAAAGPVMIMVLNSRSKVRLYVQGTAVVDGITPRPTLDGRTARGRLKLTITATGIRGVSVSGTDPAIPLDKWPEPGAVLPVQVLKGTPRKFTVLWDRVQTHQEVVLAQRTPVGAGASGDSYGYSVDGDDYGRPRQDAYAGQLPPDDTPTLTNLPPIDAGIDEPQNTAQATAPTGASGAQPGGRTRTAVAEPAATPAEQIPDAARRPPRKGPPAPRRGRPRHAVTDPAHSSDEPLGAAPATATAAFAETAIAAPKTEPAIAAADTDATGTESTNRTKATDRADHAPGTGESTDETAQSPDGTAQSPDGTAENPAGTADSTQGSAVSTQETTESAEEPDNAEESQSADRAEGAGAGQTIIGDEDEPIIMRLRSSPTPGGPHRRPSPHPRSGMLDRVRRSRPGRSRPPAEPPPPIPPVVTGPSKAPGEPDGQERPGEYTIPEGGPVGGPQIPAVTEVAAGSEVEWWTEPETVEAPQAVEAAESQSLERPVTLSFYPDREMEQPPTRVPRIESSPVIEGQVVEQAPPAETQAETQAASPAQPAPADEARTQQAPAEEPRMQEAQTQEAQTQEAQTQEAQTQEARTQQAPAEEGPAEPLRLEWPTGSAWSANGRGPVPVGMGPYTAPPVLRAPSAPAGSPASPGGEDDDEAVTPDPYATEHYLPPEDQLEEQPLSDGAVAEFLATAPRRAPMPLDGVNGVSITLIVSDLQRSRRFYRETLGLTELDSGPTSAVLETGTARVVLRRVADMPPVDRRVVHLNLDVPDVYEAYERLREQGVDFVHRPRVVPQGEQLELCSATFRDPDGHAIALTRWELRR